MGVARPRPASSIDEGREERWAIIVDTQRRLARIQARSAAAKVRADETKAVSDIAFVVMAENGTVDEVTASEHMDVFAPWQPGVAYAVGQLLTYGQGEGVRLYKCVQAHTAQADWTPEAAASLWALAGDPNEEWPAWSQPIGAHDAYGAGEKVSHQDKHWVSGVDGNVWEPGVYGWDEADA